MLCKRGKGREGEGMEGKGRVEDNCGILKKLTTLSLFNNGIYRTLEPLGYIYKGS